ncbi:MAG: hypothetical protein JSR31_07580 [Nitrospira sp.]|nr:hypothetical protein [Nitrospira sp.]
MRRPNGMLGFNWGDNVEKVILQLGLSGGAWNQWLGGGGFDVYSHPTRMVKVFEQLCLVCLVSRAVKFEGIQFIFSDCDRRKMELSNVVRSGFGMEASKRDLYHVWSTGEVIRFAREQDRNICILTVTGPKFGRAHQAYLLTRGFRELFNSLQPH